VARVSSLSQQFKPWIDRLGAMSLAIILLVVMAIASVIGTVLIQNQAQQDYLNQFGPLWYWVFRLLGLFDMYHSWWFLALLGFLMLSLAVCLWRNTPRMLKEMRKGKVVIADKSLQRFHHLQHWNIEDSDISAVQERVRRQLGGWNLRLEGHDGKAYLRADKGRFNKLGYILVHAAILVILIGGWVSVHYGFRGSMTVVEGGDGDTIGFLKGTVTATLKMPFTIHCDKFFIDFYPTGMPKAFRSTLSIMDGGKEVIHKKAIIVNEPLLYKGVRIYQASFGDGGSKIKLNLFHLDDGSKATINTKVYDTWHDKKTGMSLEIVNFRPFNIENMANQGEPKDFKDLGPAVELIVRGPGLKPVKVKSFMNPIELKGENRGHLMFVSTTGEDQDYEPFLLGLDFTKATDWQLYKNFVDVLKKRRGSSDKSANFAAFNKAMHKVFGDKRPKHFEQMGNRVIQAMSSLPNIPWPFIPILEDYDQVYYTGLQLSRDPGMNIVWLGSAILVIGLCIMFYMPRRKLWVVIRPVGKNIRLSVGGMTNRNMIGFKNEFHEILRKLDHAFETYPNQGEQT